MLQQVFLVSTYVYDVRDLEISEEKIIMQIVPYFLDGERSSDFPSHC